MKQRHAGSLQFSITWEGNMGFDRVLRLPEPIKNLRDFSCVVTVDAITVILGMSPLETDHKGNTSLAQLL